MTFAAEYRAREERIAVLVAKDLAEPQPGRRRERARQIADLEHAIHMLRDVEEYRNRKPNKRGEMQRGDTEALWERADYLALASEANDLRSVERELAIHADFPVWQGGQHFTYERAGELRDGEVIAIDIEQGLVAAHTWPHQDICASLSAKSEVEFITRAEIEAGEARERREERERAERQQTRQRAERGAEQVALF